MQKIKVEQLTAENFAPYGDVIEIAKDVAHHPINGGTTERFHDLGTAVATGKNARTIISMARAQPFVAPFLLPMMERHPFGSQAFIPVKPTRFLVTVALDENGKPGAPRSFLATKGQGVNYALNTWHGVLTALDDVTDFIIVDRDGVEMNLQEHHFDEPFEIVI